MRDARFVSLGLCGLATQPLKGKIASPFDANRHEDPRSLGRVLGVLLLFDVKQVPGCAIVAYRVPRQNIGSTYYTCTLGVTGRYFLPYTTNFQTTDNKNNTKSATRTETGGFGYGLSTGKSLPSETLEGT